MSTKKQPLQPTGKTFFHAEDNGETVSLSVEGNAKDLMNLFANVFHENEDLRRVIEMALIIVETENDKQSNPMAAILALMASVSDENEG